MSLSAGMYETQSRRKKTIMRISDNFEEVVIAVSSSDDDQFISYGRARFDICAVWDMLKGALAHALLSKSPDIKRCQAEALYILENQEEILNNLGKEDLPDEPA